MNVDPSTISPVSTQASAKSASRASGASASLFSTQLASATTKSTSAGDSSTSAKAPTGEKTEAVAGHKYAEIIAGPRNGLFLNTSGNARDGDAFARIRREGREFHIYGTGKHRVIVQVKRSDSSSDSSGSSTAGTSGSQTTSSSAATTTDTTAPATA